MDDHTNDRNDLEDKHTNKVFSLMLLVALGLVALQIILIEYCDETMEHVVNAGGGGAAATGAISWPML